MWSLFYGVGTAINGCFIPHWRGQVLVVKHIPLGFTRQMFWFVYLQPDVLTYPTYVHFFSSFFFYMDSIA